MKTRMALGALIAITTVLIMTGMQTTPSTESTLESNFTQAENVTDHDSTGIWQTVLMGDGKECEGLVFDSIEDAEQEALTIGCSGFHEHHKEDGTVIYMPCNLEDVNTEDIKAELLDALTRGEITQEQVDEKLAWLEAKNLE